MANYASMQKFTLFGFPTVGQLYAPKNVRVQYLWQSTGGNDG